ncbi:uncharacterized protein BDW70DRAFT_131522 [Aspergillus foveolatus]|uniref:uncharacterized protein n=1 Tax=Aspergillus foveolatus TaxID=210207 RepID=UPI003CCC993F
MSGMQTPTSLAFYGLVSRVRNLATLLRTCCTAASTLAVRLPLPGVRRVRPMITIYSPRPTMATVLLKTTSTRACLLPTVNSTSTMKRPSTSLATV